MKHWTRRDFLKTSIFTGSAVALARNSGAATASGGGSANGDIRLAIVGFRGKGAHHIKMFRDIPGVRLAALCDVDSAVLDGQTKRFAAKDEKVAAYRDYRKLLEDKTIDAVVIATPNHWHSLMAVWACQAGKDVYVEKPVSHNVWEGRKVVEAARKYNRIVQAGTQSRSDEALQQVFDYIRQGNLGSIQWVRGLCYKARPSIGKTTGPQPIPGEVDYDLWLGPAAMTPLRRRRLHYDWHWFWTTGNADIGNQGIHEMDMCRWALGQRGLPPKVMSIGGRFGYEDDAETPNTQISVLAYEPAPLIFEVRGLPRKAGDSAMDNYRGIRVGLVVQCEKGYFAGGAGGGWVYDNKGEKVKQFSSSGGAGHQANFIKAVRSRKTSDLAADIEQGHVSSALCHLANISYRLGKDSAADAIKEAIMLDANTKDSFQRFADHLAANQVNVPATPAVLGPALSLAPDKEVFVSKEKYDLGFWANALLKDAYRPPFAVPESV
ncbi:MAG: Gfo/Idh/MocA family oxidoreductase [Verrucomicrobiia bacterium]|jgi:predicted dehydrogenase